MIQSIGTQMQVQAPQDTGQPQTKNLQDTGSFRSLLRNLQPKSDGADAGSPETSGTDLKKETAKDASTPPQGSAQTAQAQNAAARQNAQGANSVSSSPSPTQTTGAQRASAAAVEASGGVPAAFRQSQPDGATQITPNASPTPLNRMNGTAQTPQTAPAAPFPQAQADGTAQAQQNIPITAQAPANASAPPLNQTIGTVQAQQITPAAQQSAAAETAQSSARALTASEQSTKAGTTQIFEPQASAQSTAPGTIPAAESTVPPVPSSSDAGSARLSTGEMPAAEQEKARAQEKLPATETGKPSAQPMPVFYSSGKLIVKVSDAPAAPKTPVGSQIANAVADALKNGKQQFQVDLYPQSLGKVSVNLISQNGMLTVEIAAQNPKTQSLIASSSGEIRSLLQSSASQTVQVTARPQDAQYTGQNGTPYQQQSSQQQQQQQQQQEDTERRQTARWYTTGNSCGLSTGDFLTVLRKAAV